MEGYLLISDNFKSCHGLTIVHCMIVMKGKKMSSYKSTLDWEGGVTDHKPKLINKKKKRNIFSSSLKGP